MGHGVPQDKALLYPGLGFDKRSHHNANFARCQVYHVGAETLSLIWKCVSSNFSPYLTPQLFWADVGTLGSLCVLLSPFESFWFLFTPFGLCWDHLFAKTNREGITSANEHDVSLIERPFTKHLLSTTVLKIIFASLGLLLYQNHIF